MERCRTEPPGGTALQLIEPAAWTTPLPMTACAAIPRTASFEEFRAAALGPATQDLAFQHSADVTLDLLPQGLVRGANWFGPGDCTGMTDSAINIMRGVCAYALGEAVLSPASMSILTASGGLLDGSVDNLAFWNGDIASLDPNFVDLPEGRAFLCHPDDIAQVACIAIPVCGVGFPNFGHFLFDGLGAAWLLKQLLDDPRIRLVGPPLLGWQAEILDLLGCRAQYLAIAAPTRFSRLVFTDMLAFQTAYPARGIRPVFDALRFRCGEPDDSGRRVLLSRSGDRHRRHLRNRTDMESLFASHGFEVIRPERLSVREQVRLLAGARCVAGETGSALASIGFCDPGAAVLEIIPDCYPDNWIRSAARIFGHDWHGYFARVNPADIEARHRFAFDVNLPMLDRALVAIARKPGSRR
jgi:hypothetical protein